MGLGFSVKVRVWGLGFRAPWSPCVEQQGIETERREKEGGVVSGDCAAEVGRREVGGRERSRG